MAVAVLGMFAGGSYCDYSPPMKKLLPILARLVLSLTFSATLSTTFSTVSATTAQAQRAPEASAPGAPAAPPAGAAAGPAVPAEPSADRSSDRSSDRSYEELEATARRLAAAIGMPAERQAVTLGRLRTAFQRGKVAAFAGGLGINGVFAYQMGEGGFLVKVKKGKGLAAILGDGRDVPLTLKSVTFGAQVGGGSEWGFGVILGLRVRGAFGGDYSGDNRGATAGQESVNITKLVKKGVSSGDPLYHELYMIGAAAGLSAGAALGSLNITAY